MATVTNLANRVCTYTGLATSGAERTLVLEFLNDVYKQSCEYSEIYRTTCAAKTLTAGTWEYTLTASPFSLTDVDRLDRVMLTDSAVTELSLKPMPATFIRDQRSGVSQSNSTPLYYATPYPGRIWFHPPPASGTTVIMDYLATPPTLVESAPGAGEESTPSAFKALFHYRVLATGAIAMAMDSDQRDDADRWWQRYYVELDNLVAYVNEYTGRNIQLPFFNELPRRVSNDRSFDG